MRTYIRADAAGATCFFTLTLQDRGARWLVDHVDLLRAAVKHAKTRHTQSLVANGVLRDDVAPGRGLKGERKLWQRRFWEHQIHDEEDFQRHVDYIHYNPVKHGWVARANEWPYSSFHRFVREGIVAPDWGISATVEGQFGE
ncbi:hypothetical protein [Ramlibacter alkalitolerans]|uniref:Transposase IS200-like domain-containing protein n=1 Tax=Ramlibacter alkalitolerans TaxID=2039631 RepID=A0ABS1JKR2_9BURK|nr:hypothetical protein [Ramlibacter alkalitolerans]MBL0424825.1 hypothetical protein [Ramlibacter alkalitolerans]